MKMLESLVKTIDSKRLLRSNIGKYKEYSKKSSEEANFGKK